MTRKEKNKFVRILKLLESSTHLLDDHYEDIFGTPAKPTWAPEDHVHTSTGAIVDIRFTRHGIFYGADDWMNSDGERVWCAFKYSAEPKFTWSKKHHKFEWTVPNACVNFDPSKSKDAFVENYLLKVSESVLHYLIDNFNELNVERNINSIYNRDARCTFGLALKSSYYYKKQRKELNEKHSAIFVALDGK